MTPLARRLSRYKVDLAILAATLVLLGIGIGTCIYETAVPPCNYHNWRTGPAGVVNDYVDRLEHPWRPSPDTPLLYLPQCADRDDD